MKNLNEEKNYQKIVCSRPLVIKIVHFDHEPIRARDDKINFKADFRFRDARTRPKLKIGNRLELVLIFRGPENKYRKFGPVRGTNISSVPRTGISAQSRHHCSDFSRSDSEM